MAVRQRAELVYVSRTFDRRSLHRGLRGRQPNNLYDNDYLCRRDDPERDSHGPYVNTYSSTDAIANIDTLTDTDTLAYAKP